MPEVSGKLNFSLLPGHCSMQGWQMNVSGALSRHPEFARVGKRGREVVWRLNQVHTPAKPASKVIQGGKGKFMGIGKSMGQGGH